MKVCYLNKNLSDAKLAIIHQANEIIDEYLVQDLRLTLRQLYYQFVARDLIPNTPQSYKKLGDVIGDGRLAGYIDWDAIEDRARRPIIPPDWESIGEIGKLAAEQFRLPRWDDQTSYVELAVEKDALAGVLAPLGKEYHVPLMVNRGYSSLTAMREWAMRINERCTALEGKKRVIHRKAYVLYLGDHDPSGEDMVRDVRDRLLMFLRWGEHGHNLVVKKVALTMPQIQQYNPPPNPAKMTDSRSKEYVEKHGYESWEVDALNPVTLTNLIRNEFERLVDKTKMERVKKREKEQKETLLDAMRAAGLLEEEETEE